MRTRDAYSKTRIPRCRTAVLSTRSDHTHNSTSRYSYRYSVRHLCQGRGKHLYLPCIIILLRPRYDSKLAYWTQLYVAPTSHTSFSMLPASTDTTPRCPIDDQSSSATHTCFAIISTSLFLSPVTPRRFHGCRSFISFLILPRVHPPTLCFTAHKNLPTSTSSLIAVQI